MWFQESGWLWFMILWPGVPGDPWLGVCGSSNPGKMPTATIQRANDAVGDTILVS